MKKVIFIFLPLLLIGGGVALAGRMGFVNIPGLTPPKKKLSDLKKAEPVAEIKVTKPKAPEPEAPKDNPAAGQETIAKIWAEMDSKKLVLLTEKWRPNELAPVFMKMDPSKVTEILSEMEAPRSSEISRAIQRLASAGS
jgi:flagellar motility protein MotE (MotC chaperone)